MYQLKKQSTVTLIERLCEELDREGVLYCQWKGHWKQQRWASGEGDIDLLVDSVDGDRFVSILCRVGFKQAMPPVERQIPGTSHYYGLDSEVDKFIHLHVHHQIIFGHHATMTYHLPLERPLLASSRPGKFFRTPAPEFELILFVISAIVRYSIYAATIRKERAWSLAERQNLEYLNSLADAAKTRQALERYLPLVEPTFFESCLRSLQRQCSHWTRLKLKWQLHSRLKAHLRRAQFIDFLLRLKYWVINRICRRVRRGSRNYLTSGGKLIALVGGDGAGKSTAVTALYEWLSRSFCTTTIHLGKPSPSVCTIVVAIARRVALLFGKLFDLVRPLSTANRRRFTLHDYLLLLRSVCIARDRYCLYKRARRLATNGTLVICDRYPTPQIESMDGPNISRLIPPGHMNRISAFLQETEASYYRQIMPADVMIVLKVRPEIAVQRKTDEDADYVRARSLEVWKLDLSQTAHVLDAGRAKTDVLDDLKNLVWSEL